MVNCSFCNKEVKRNIFCSPSCKTRFHRGDASSDLEPFKEAIKKNPAPPDVESYAMLDVPIPPKTRRGWCQAHFEKGTEYDVVKIEYRDENDEVVFTGEACPKCLAKYEKLGKGEVIYV